MTTYGIKFPNGNLYSYHTRYGVENNWPLHRAKIIARNVARKHKVTVSLVPFTDRMKAEQRMKALEQDLPGMWSYSDFTGGPPDEVRGPDWKPPTVTYDSIVEYVSSLKGVALSSTLAHNNLPVGKDPVASKRQRLLMHLCKQAGLSH